MGYSEIIDALGLSQNKAEALIVLGFVVAFIGFVLFMFWQYIAMGLGALAILSVFAHHVNTETMVATVQKAEEIIERKEEVVEEKPEKPDPEKIVYMEDCESLTQKPEICKEAWAERKADTTLKEPEIVVEKKEPTKKIQKASLSDGFKAASQVKLIDTDNEEYKARRAEALKKPGAVVFQDTYR